MSYFDKPLRKALRQADSSADQAASGAAAPNGRVNGVVQTNGRKPYYREIRYGRVEGGLDPERISPEQWMAIGEEDLRCGLWPDVGPRPGMAGCKMPAELQRLYRKGGKWNP